MHAYRSMHAGYFVYMIATVGGLWALMRCGPATYRSPTISWSTNRFSRSQTTLNFLYLPLRKRRQLPPQNLGDFDTLVKQPKALTVYELQTMYSKL